MNNETKMVEMEVLVCPGCDEPLPQYAKVVDDWAFHDLYCRQQAIEKGIVVERTYVPTPQPQRPFESRPDTSSNGEVEGGG